MFLIIMMNMPLVILVMALFILSANLMLTPVKMIFLVLSMLLIFSLYSLTHINSLYLIIIMLIYISGLMMMFSYFVSLMNKKMFLGSTKKMFFLFISLFLILFSNYCVSKNSDKPMKNKLLKIFKIYCSKYSFFLLLMMTILILLLVISVKICKNEKSSLRQKMDE